MKNMITKKDSLFQLKSLMPKLPQVSATKLIKALEKIGFKVVSQKGSHIKMVDSKGRITTIPNHKSIKKGTLKKGILNPLDISVEDLIKLLRKK